MNSPEPFDDLEQIVGDEAMLAALAAALCDNTLNGITKLELKLLRNMPSLSSDLIKATKDEIAEGGDPLGRMFCSIRSAESRRENGAFYTPQSIVDTMLTWAECEGDPTGVIDPGAGSGRFLVEAGRRFPKANLIAVEPDPLAALMVRANLASCGMSERAEIRVENFLNTPLDDNDGRTLFVGNPPYVRHHLIPSKSKDWLKRQADSMGLRASALAGLHVYFFLAIARRAKNGDYGALITASEWLDVNYGQLVRDLFLGRLGGESVYVIQPHAEPFPGTATTGAVTTFTVDSKPMSARFARVRSLSELKNLRSKGRRVRRERLIVEKRWSHFTRTPIEVPEGYVELGDLCRVHRGQVTGANRVWIAGDHSDGLPDEWLFPSITRARELIHAGPVLDDTRDLKRVIDLPSDLSSLREKDRPVVQQFLTRAEEMGARESYTARHRCVWWSVKLRDPAPILATYMARRAPAFVLNKANVRHLNVAHGLYPRENMSTRLLQALVSYLRGATSTEGGRVYAGGLTKFEPREMERIAVPNPKVLLEIVV